MPPKDPNSHIKKKKKNQSRDPEASSREWAARTQKEEDSHLTLSHSVSWGPVFVSQGYQLE